MCYNNVFHNFREFEIKLNSAIFHNCITTRYSLKWVTFVFLLLYPHLVSYHLVEFFTNFSVFYVSFYVMFHFAAEEISMQI